MDGAVSCDVPVCRSGEKPLPCLLSGQAASRKTGEQEPRPAPASHATYGPSNAANRANRRRAASPSKSLPTSPVVRCQQGASPSVSPSGSPPGSRSPGPRPGPAVAGAKRRTARAATAKHIAFVVDASEAADVEPQAMALRREQRSRTAAGYAGQKLPWDDSSPSGAPTLPSSYSEKSLADVARPGSKIRARSEKLLRDPACTPGIVQDTPARARSQSTPKEGDTFNLDRFTEAQKDLPFAKALSEIEAGRKSSCWMWYVIPSPPHMKKNREHGSCLNRKYAIRSDEEARAYLCYESHGVDLRSNYFDIMVALREQLKAGKAARSVIGSFDEPKLGSSVLLFERITRGEDKELNALLVEIAGLMEISSV